MLNQIANIFIGISVLVIVCCTAGMLYYMSMYRRDVRRFRKERDTWSKDAQEYFNKNWG